MRALAMLFIAALPFATPVFAQQDTVELARLRRQIEALSREVESLRLGAEVAPVADTSLHGLGPAAAKVYRVNRGVSIGGYGEVLYENYAAEREDDTPSGLRDQIDALRLIAYLGYKFSDKFLFNSEIEFEHASTGQGGEASVEFAYLDWLIRPEFGARAGMVLVPMGLLNELHEPPIFLGTTRPLTENAIIPSTWRENGIGFFGEASGLSYRAYVINGLDAVGGPTSPSRASGFSSGGLRGGRQKGARGLIETPAIVARADYAPSGALQGLMVGGSVYFGDSGNNFQPATGPEVEVPTTIFEGHAQYRAYGLDLRGLYARASLDDVATLNQVRGLTGGASIGEALEGWYVQAGYDVLRTLETSHSLTPYVRYEKLNTQKEVPAGFTSNRANDRQVTVIGAAWKPITNIVLKLDYQLHKNEAETGVRQFNVALGYLF